MTEVFWRTASSTCRDASRRAASTRSWSVSTSPGSTAERSIVTESTSFSPDISIRTSPPPAEPSRRIAFSSACTLPCIAWACCIIFSMFMARSKEGPRSLLLLHFRQLGAEEIHRGPDHRVGLRPARRVLPGDGGSRDVLGHLAEIAVGRRTGLQGHPHRPPECFGGDVGEELARRRVVERFLRCGAVDAEPQDELVPLRAGGFGETDLRRGHAPAGAEQLREPTDAVLLARTRSRRSRRTGFFSHGHEREDSRSSFARAGPFFGNGGRWRRGPFGGKARERLLDRLQAGQLRETEDEHLENEAALLRPAGELIRVDGERQRAEEVLVGHRAGEREKTFPVTLRDIRNGARGGEQEAAPELDEFLQDVPGVLPSLRELRQRSDGGGAVAGGDPGVDRLEELPVDQCENVGARRRVHVATGERRRLVEKRKSVAEAPFRGRRQRRESVRGRPDVFLARDLLEVPRDLRDGQRPEREPLTARDNRRRNLVELGRSQDETGMGRRLLERLQERIECLGRQHVDFVDDRDAEPVALRSVADRLDQLAGVLDLAVRGAVHLVDVERIPAREDLPAGGAFPARLDRGPAIAVQTAGEEPRGRRLSDPAGPGQQVSGRHAPVGDGIRERARDGVLADQVRKGPRAPLARERKVSARAIDHQWSGRRRWAQVDLRRTGAPPDRCFLPDLTRFRGFRRTGPEPISGGRGAILSESRAVETRERERRKQRNRAGEADHEIDALKAVRRKMRPGPDLVAERVEQGEESEPDEAGRDRRRRPPAADHAFRPARARTKASTDRARSGGISSGFRSFSVLPVAR